MAKIFMMVGALSAMITVALGAVGAHALKAKLGDKLAIFEKAVLYQFVSSLGLLILGVMIFHLKDSSFIKWSGINFMVGIVLFSGSLYLYSITQIKVFAHITPFGGLAMIAAWALMAVAVYKGL